MPTPRLQALLEQEAGEYGTAKPLFQQALADLEELLGPKHTDVGWCLVDYSLLLHRTGDYDESLAASARATGIFEEVLGSDHPSVAAPLNLNAMVRLAIFSDPDLDSLRDDPSFEALAARVRQARSGG